MVNSCKPNLFLIAIFFSLFSQIVSPADANTSVSKLVDEFCNRKNFFTQPAFCLQVFRYDPRSATVSDNVALAKIAMEQVIANLEKIQSKFSQNQNAGPSLGPVLASCADNYGALVKAFKFHFDLAISGKDDDDELGTWDYDLHSDGDYIAQCSSNLGSAVPRDESLVKKSEIALNYYNLGFRVTNLVVAKFFPELSIPEN